jgi:hypothetical protein
MDDFIHGHHTVTEGRAAGTIEDFIHGRQGALWMTSSMDAIQEEGPLAQWMTSSMDTTEGGKQKVL